MSVTPETPPSEIPDWDAIYRRGTPPWDSGRPSAELVRMVRDGVIQPCSVLELGCGTGADAIFLAQQKFDVTAVEASAIALERARNRAEQEDALLRFVLADVFEFAREAEQFDLVFDGGFYHFIRRTQLDRFLDLLWRVTQPGSLYLTLAGDVRKAAGDGPPQVSEDQVHAELGRLFECVELRACRIESSEENVDYPGWSCLMRRPTMGTG